MKVSQNAKTVLEKRYLKRDAEGNVTETTEGLFKRVSDAIAASDLIYDKNADVEALSEKFYDMMTNMEFLPNSPTLMNAGRPLGQLSACFVLPVADTMEDIFEAIKQAALIHKSGGGTGFSFSRLRAKGSVVNSTGGVASGPISFMRVFNTATEAVKQGGTRRGANMGILRVDHPDILEFIDCKKDSKEITNFNISVGITEKFMNAAFGNLDYEIIDPSTKKVVGTLKAREVFNKIVRAAWQNGEPGIIFLDRLNRDNIVPTQGEIESTNPCGEQPLLPYESCNLGSINLIEMLKKENGESSFDFEKIEKTVKLAVHFLDNVIDANKYPLEIIDFTTKQTRKIGLGVMGWADALLYMGIPYNSDRAVELGEQVMGFITEKGKEESRKLAKTRGAFPLFKESTLKDGEPIRNATITTIAPTGTLSIIAGVSSGIEPVFGYVFIRNVMDNTEMIEVNGVLKEKLLETGIYSEDLMKEIAEEGSLHHIDEIPENIKDVFVSAHDVSPIWHIKMQAAFQKYTDNAVSKTVNFSNDATVGDVSEVYELAFKLGCKGVTIYRDGSRSEQVLNIGKVIRETDGRSCDECEQYEQMKKNLLEQNPASAACAVVPRPRPNTTLGMTEKAAIGCGNLYITVNYDDHGICEVFTNTGKHGGCPSQSEATSRLISIALRSGIDSKYIIEQLKGIRCPSTIRQKGMSATSCPDAIGRLVEKVVEYQKHGKTPLSELIADHVGELVKTDSRNLDFIPVAGQMRICPECGTLIEHEGGCVICRNCGYSKCN